MLRAPLLGQFCVALLGKGMPFLAKCALPWPGSGALSITEFTERPTSNSVLGEFTGKERGAVVGAWFLKMIFWKERCRITD
jgi:hypothetical protein